MSAPRQVHLLCADEALAEGYRHGGPLALCGEPLGTSDLPSASCPDECYCELTYCPGCLDVATRHNWEAGLEVALHPGSPRRRARGRVARWTPSSSAWMVKEPPGERPPRWAPSPPDYHTRPAVTGTRDEACPYCRVTNGVQSTPAPPSVQAWTCTRCPTDWAITVVPRPYPDHLAATIEQLNGKRSVPRQVITLADDAATLSDTELRDRLLALADKARQRP
jgi:hypothetical protein